MLGINGRPRGVKPRASVLAAHPAYTTPSKRPDLGGQSLSSAEGIRTMKQAIWWVKVMAFLTLASWVTISVLTYRLYQDSNTLDEIAEKTNIVLDNAVGMSNSMSEDFVVQRPLMLDAMVNGEATMQTMRQFIDAAKQGGLLDVIQKMTRDAGDIETVMHRMGKFATLVLTKDDD